jgi:integrase
MAPNTIRKHCGAVQAVLDLCGPPDRKHREGVGLLDVVPYVPRPRREATSRVDMSFTACEVQRLIDHAQLAQLPTDLPCSAGVYLARLYVVLFNTGVRIGGAMGATWKHFETDHLTLRARVAAKGFRDLRVELNDAARAVVESMRGADSERIFPWPRTWPASRHSLYDQHALVSQCLPPARRFGFHAFRRLHTELLDAINPAAVQMALGWTTGRTANEFYRSRKLVATSVAQLPVLRAGCGRQQRLFD